MDGDGLDGIIIDDAIITDLTIGTTIVEGVITVTIVVEDGNLSAIATADLYMIGGGTNNN